MGSSSNTSATHNEAPIAWRTHDFHRASDRTVGPTNDSENSSYSAFSCAISPSLLRFARRRMISVEMEEYRGAVSRETHDRNRHTQLQSWQHKQREKSKHDRRTNRRDQYIEKRSEGWHRTEAVLGVNGPHRRHAVQHGDRSFTVLLRR
jgi:hypothetical protein